MEQRFANKHALVTGAGSGIGRATAMRLAAEGATVAVMDVVADGAADTVAEIEGAGGSAMAVSCDVRSWEATEAAVGQVTAELGRLDVVCNVAGIGGFQESHTADPEMWDRMVGINLTGTFHVCRAVLPGMVERGEGSIVNTASTAGIMGQPWSAAYCASKGGVIMLTKALATEYDLPLRINAVAPGGVDTPMYGQFMPPEGVDWNRMKKMSRDNVAPASPERLARFFAFVASDDADYMTGAIVVADGGISI
ncbi:SDR family NAD(P)-dependent oxidoreductase [Rhabdothermincola salaria]|uniref:SDR family NAD(P)-dependent oxidoreductase n=1 Tax=Rhabdothermincola salaria TaxID=2903142 RepID=UPI001E5D8FB1|nr:SDR family oxidoreductase [Rhabdothermincola salaria]MCD9622249.1 SDR family oxidoreductase [Rhabdothermincola salaria]